MCGFYLSAKIQTVKKLRVERVKKVKKKLYRIIQVRCHPDPIKWKVVADLGRVNKDPKLFHANFRDAKRQIEEKFDGELLEIIYMRN